MKTIVVLGMHRSATSLIAKSLNHEIHMGSVMVPPLPGNPLGHFENQRWVNLNDTMLRNAGGEWNKLPSKEEIAEANQHMVPAIKNLIMRETNDARAKGKEIWGWKDPRTVLTIDLIAPHLENPHFVCVFREVDEIAKSLATRDGSSFEFGKQLAQEYNRRLFDFLSKWEGFE